MTANLLTRCSLGTLAFISLLLSPRIQANAETGIVKNTLAYKSVEGHEILLDTHVGPTTTKRPAVTWIHGGRLIFGTRMWLPEEQLKRYSAAGYAVFSIDHRLVPETKLPEILEYIRDAYQ